MNANLSRSFFCASWSLHFLDSFDSVDLLCSLVWLSADLLGSLVWPASFDSATRGTNDAELGPTRAEKKDIKFLGQENEMCN